MERIIRSDVFTSPAEVVEAIEQYRKSQGISITQWSAGWCKMDYWTWWRIVNGQADYRYHADLLSELAGISKDAFLLICDLESEQESAERHEKCKDAYASSNHAFTVINFFRLSFSEAVEDIFLEDFFNSKKDVSSIEVRAKRRYMEEQLDIAVEELEEVTEQITERLREILDEQWEEGQGNA